MVRRVHWFALLLVALIVAAYSNTLRTPFQFDDYNVIVSANGVHSWAAWAADLGHGFRPLLKLTYTLNWLSGMDAPGFHAFNILLHFANSLLVYALSCRLCALTGQQKIGVTLAALTALLFALHPAHTEAVTYISGRSTSLMTFFYLAALLAYAHGREHGHGVSLYLVSPLLFVLAVASKETAITLPAALLLWERCCYPASSWREALRKQVVHGLVFFSLAVLLLMQERYWTMMAFSVNLRSVSENLFTQLHAMTYLLGQLLFPVQMNIDPDLPIRTSLLSVVPDMGLWSVLSGLALWRARRNPLAFFALGWLVLQLFPLYVFLPRLDVANDRQLYLADWPVFTLIVSGVTTVLPRVKSRIVVVAALVLFCATATWLRNRDYISEIALWEATVRTSPHKARPQNNLGYAYFLSGREAEAELAFRAALHNDKYFWRAENNLIRLRENRQ